MDNNFFVCYIKEFLDSPLEDSYGYANEPGLSFIPSPTSQDWEREFLGQVQGDEPVVCAIQVYGFLDNLDDLNDLEEWLEYTRYPLGPASREIIDAARERLLNPPGALEEYDDSDIAALLDSDSATEELSATEGPLFSAIKDGIKSAVKNTAGTLKNTAQAAAAKMGNKSAQIAQANSSTTTSAIFTSSKGPINEALAGAEVKKDIAIPIAQAVVYVTGQMMSGSQANADCYALLQSSTGARGAINIADSVRADNAFVALAAQADAAASRNEVYEPTPKEQVDINSAQKAVLATAQNNVKSAKANLGKNVYLVGYSNDEAIIQAWTKKASSGAAQAGAPAGFSLDNIDWSNAKQRQMANDMWLSFSAQSGAKEKMFKKVIPPSIVSAQRALLSYFYPLTRPFSDYVWDIVLAQGHIGLDPSADAFKYLVDSKRVDVFEKIFKQYGIKGLDLTDGDYSGNQDVAQLPLIFIIGSKKPAFLPEFLSGGAWLSKIEMQGLLSESTEQGKDFLARFRAQSQSAITTDTLAQLCVKYKVLDNNDNLYRKDDWADFTLKLEEATEVSQKKDVEKKEVQDAYNALVAARNKLEEAKNSAAKATKTGAKSNAAVSANSATISYAAAKKFWEALDPTGYAAAVKQPKAKFMQLFAEMSKGVK